MTSAPKSALRAFRFAGGCLAGVAIGCASPAIAQKAPSTLQQIDRDRLCVTNGAVSALGGGRLAVETPSSRAFVQADAENSADQVAEIRFQYLGPSQDSKPLASGELRRQIGLKLHTEDTCNLIYAMWHIEPDSRVAVSVKRNLGMHTHEQCGAHGYINFSAQDRGLPPMRPGEAHALRAELHDKDLIVTADGKVAWQGALGTEAALPVGPPGFRTDNAAFAFEYLVDPASGARRSAQHAPPSRSPCVISEGD